MKAEDKNTKVKATGDKGDTIKKVKPKAKRKSTRDNRRPSFKKRFLELLVDEEILGNVKYAAKRLGVNRNTLYEWREKDKKFAAAWDKVKEEADALLVEEAENALLQGIRKGNPTLIIYTLNNRSPDRWRARLEHTGEGGGPIEHTVSPEFAEAFGLDENEKRTDKKAKHGRG